MRLEKVLKEMQKRQLTHLIISDPSSIDYLINYKNNPGERMYLLLLSSDGHHKLFMNNLFYLDHELDIEQVWYSDTDNYLQLLADEFDGACSIGIDKNFPARFLIPLMNLVDECHFELGSECVDRVRMIKDEKEQQLMIEASKINDLVVDEVINICAKGNLTEEEVSEFHHALDAYGINMEKSSLYAVPTSTCNLLLSKDQCQPYYPNGRQCWDMKRRDFVTGKESVP